MKPVINHPIPLDIDFKEWMFSMPLVTLDFETYYDDQYSLKRMTMVEYLLDPRFKAQGVALRVDNIIDGKLERGEITYYRNCQDAADYLKTLDKWVLIGQNTKFDGGILHYHYNVHPTVYADTKSMSKGLWPFESASLSELCKRLWPGNEQMRKGDELIGSKGVQEWTEEMHLLIGEGYCRKDVFLTGEAFWRMVNDYPSQELEVIHITCRMFCYPVMEADHGILVEAIKQEAIERKALLENALSFIQAAIEEKGLDYWNPEPKEAKKRLPLDKKILTSRNRFIKLMDEIFERPIPMKTKPDGKKTHATGKNDPEFIEYMEENVDLQILFDAKLAWASSQSSSRAKRMIAFSPVERGREIPIPLGYYNAHTGRYSGEEKVNMQNLQRASPHRLALYAPKGYKTHVCDSSNIEARAVATLARQDDLVEEFRNKEDVYSNFASDLYGFKVDKKQHAGERGVGKVSVLGLGYGMGPPTFHRTLASGPMGMPPVRVPMSFAEKTVQLYRSKYYMIKNYWQEAARAIEHMITLPSGEELRWGPLTIIHEAIILPNGMKLNYPRLQYREDMQSFAYWNGRFWKRLYGGSLVENICQAIARIIVAAEQMTRVDRYLQQFGGWVTMQVHDENIGVALDLGEKENEKLFAGIQNIMRQSPAWLPQIPLDSEGGYDDNYSK